jgi:L-asparaginase
LYILYCAFHTVQQAAGNVKTYKDGNGMTEVELPRVAVLSLGGTVAMTSDEGAGATPTVDAAGLVAAVPGLTERARVVAEALSSIPGASLRLPDLIGFVGRMESLCDEGAEGVVVTTGTDTLEEVAYLFDLLWGRNEPLVVTGAMRTADAAGSDGPGNLLGAVTVAASREARGRGVFVVINDDVHTARAARKTHTTRLSAFESVGGPPLGRVHEGRVLLWAAEPRQPALRPSANVSTVPRVALLRLTLDQDVELLDHAAATHDGLVVEVFGAGHVPAWWVGALGLAAKRVPVAMTSRTGSGALLRSSYGFPGSERDLVGLGLHFLDDMDGVKARILLMTALLVSSDRKEVDQHMSMHAAGQAFCDDRKRS